MTAPPTDLSPFQQLILQAAQQVEQGAASISQAASSAGITVDQFKQGVSDLLAARNRFGLKLVSVDQWASLREVQRLAASGLSRAAPLAAAGSGLAAAGSKGILATIAGYLGVSVGTLVVGGLVLGAVAVGGAVWYSSRSGDSSVVPGGASPTAQVVIRSASPTIVPANTCPALATEVRLCPWSPKGAHAEACGPGYCWDGGFQGSLACKQEKLPANAGRNDLNGVKCNAGFVAQTDVCTNVVTACVAK